MSAPIVEYSDAEFLNAIARKDSEAMASIYDRYQRVIQAIFLRVTRNHSLAEELTQDFFLRIWMRAGDFNPGRGAVGPWILSIARNMAVDYVRSAQARFRIRMQSLESCDGVLALSTSARPELMLHGKRALEKAFHSLTQDQRLALELAYCEGLSQLEIARRMRAPLGTVKSWIRSGLERLRFSMGCESKSIGRFKDPYEASRRLAS